VKPFKRARLIFLLILSFTLLLTVSTAAQNKVVVIPLMEEATGPSAPVPQTGQTTSHRTGDDGDLQMGVSLPTPRFQIPSGLHLRGQGVVIDHLTELIWQYDPVDSVPQPLELSWNGAIDYCNTLDLGDYTDWRLPNLRELQSLINYKYFFPAISNAAGTGKGVGNDPFYAFQSSSYWSATTHADFSNAAWCIEFFEGHTDTSNKTDSKYVRCVR